MVMEASVNYQDILCEVRDQVARITINRPKQYNALTGQTLKELMLAVETAGGDDGDLAPGGAEGAHELDQLRLNRCQPFGRVDDNGEERDGGRDDDLREQPNAEPDQEERRQSSG